MGKENLGLRSIITIRLGNSFLNSQYWLADGNFTMHSIININYHKPLNMKTFIICNRKQTVQTCLGN